MKVTIEFELPSLPGPIEFGREGDVIAELIQADAFDWTVARGLRATVERKTADLPVFTTLDRPGAVSKGVFKVPNLEASVGAGLHSVRGCAIAVDRPAGAADIGLVSDARRQAVVTPLFRQSWRGERYEGNGNN